MKAKVKHHALQGRRNCLLPLPSRERIEGRVIR